MEAYIILGAFVLFDILTGILKGLKNGNLNSTKLRTGLYNKVSEVLSVVVAHGIEFGADYINLGVALPLRGIVVTYIALTEIISILENLGEVNPVLDKLFRPYLEKLRERSEKDDTEIRN